MIELERILQASAPDGDPGEALVLADYLLERDDLKGAASALDRAYGLSPQDPQISALRSSTLDQLKIEEHGLTFRFVPAGSFLMGSTQGDPDERPVHPVRLEAFWIAETPMTWSAFNAIVGWPAPPEFPREASLTRDEQFTLGEGYKIRMQYCESHNRGGQGLARAPAGRKNEGALWCAQARRRSAWLRQQAHGRRRVGGGREAG